MRLQTEIDLTPILLEEWEQGGKILRPLEIPEGWSPGEIGVCVTNGKPESAVIIRNGKEVDFVDIPFTHREILWLRENGRPWFLCPKGPSVQYQDGKWKTLAPFLEAGYDDYFWTDGQWRPAKTMPVWAHRKKIKITELNVFPYSWIKKKLSPEEECLFFLKHKFQKFVVIGEWELYEDLSHDCS